MSQPAWAQAFPGGVADSRLQHALVRGASGHLLAVRLADGQLLWRSAEVLQPLLLGHGLALGLMFDRPLGTPLGTPVGTAAASPSVVALALDEAGTARWRSAPLPWPAWALQGDKSAALRALHAGWLAGHIVLRWSLQPLYRGGAAPGLSKAKAAAAEGSCWLDLASGALHSAPADAARGAEPPEPSATQESSDDPCVTAQQTLGGVRYCLRQTQPAGVQPAQALHTPLHSPLHTALHTTLTAHDLARGVDLWQCLLDETPRKAPRALRS